MKRLIFTLFANLIFLSGSAMPGQLSKLTITTQNNAPFMVELNDMLYTPSRYFESDRIAPGRHRVKIHKRIGPPMGNGACSAPQTKLVYQGFLDVPQRSKVDAVLSKQGLHVVNVQPINHFGGYGQPTGWGNGGNNGNYGGYDYGQGSTCGHGYNYGTCGYGCQQTGLGNNGTCSGNCGSQCGTPYGNGGNQGFGNNPGWGTNNGWNQGGTCGHHGGNGYILPNPPVHQGMSPQAFEYVQSAMKKYDYDKDRLAIAKQAIEMNGVTSLQVQTLMKLLDYDNNKLKLGKFAYPHTVDQNNYILVNDAFDYAHYGQQLYAYISTI